MGKVLTFYAGSLGHFCDWLAPLYKRLPPEIRGVFYARGDAARRAQQLGLDFTADRPSRDADVIVVASYEDHRAAHPVPTILVNHGVGQTYNGDPDNQKAFRHPSYSGGRDRERVALYLCPSQRDADLNLSFYPDAQAVAVGPHKLDPWLPTKPSTSRKKPVVVFSGHADIHVCQETRWAFSYFSDAMASLAKEGHYTYVGHGHPRMRMYMENHWNQLRIPFFETFDQVLDEADLFVSDNSSTLYEFAATGRPVVCLNAPWYRRDINHGLRFWDAVPGIEVSEPEELSSAIWMALNDPAPAREKRERAVQMAYEDLADGHATDRAVKALTEFAESDTPSP